LSPLLLSVITFIVLCSSPTTTSADWIHPRLTASHEEARKWMDATKSTERREESEACNVSLSLGYLRSHSFLDVGLAQPLFYSFYLEKVLQPYRSHLAVASAPSTSLCYLDDPYSDCREHDGGESCGLGPPEAAICLPNSDSSIEGTASLAITSTELSKSPLTMKTSCS
jgi:hypothetical protein